MAKTSGMGATIQVADATSTLQTITNDVMEWNLATPRTPWVVTGNDKSAVERLLTLADASVSLKGAFNPAANMSHAVLSTVSSTTVQRQTKITPTSSSPPYLQMNLFFENYAVARSATAELTWEATGNLADGTVPTWS